MRAPPEAANVTTAPCSSRARSINRVTFSPTAEPIEPPMKSMSIAPAKTRWSPTLPRALTIASGKPETSRACVSRSVYGLLSTNSSGSIEITSASSSSYFPSSKSIAKRSRAPMRKWWPQCRHTCSASSRSRLYKCSSQLSHLTKTFSVFTTRSSGGTDSIRLLFLLNQAMRFA